MKNEDQIQDSNISQNPEREKESLPYYQASKNPTNDEDKQKAYTSETKSQTEREEEEEGWLGLI